MWIDQLNRVSKAGSMAMRLDGDLPEDDVNNPIREPSESGGSPSMCQDDSPTLDVQLSFMRKSSSKPPPAGLEGYLFKKSPALMTGWQRRYFVLKDPGEIDYYETVTYCSSLILPHPPSQREEYINGVSAKGTILVAEVAPDKGVAVVNQNEIRIYMGSRTYQLRAKDATEASSWESALNEWIGYLSSYD